jgi:hypothetical protein
VGDAGAHAGVGAPGLVRLFSLQRPRPGGAGGEQRAQDELKRAYEALPDPNGSVAQAKRLVKEAGAPGKPIVVAVTDSQSEMPIIGTEVKRAAAGPVLGRPGPPVPSRGRAVG